VELVSRTAARKGVLIVVAAVIWDFGGVITSSPFEAFNRFEEERGLPRDWIRRVNSTNPHDNAWALFERNEIDTAAFDLKFLEEATALGHAVRGADILPRLSGDVRPRMVAALAACKDVFKVGCITNNVQTGHGAGMAGTSDKAAQVAGVMAMFDVVIESSKAGVRKPDPRIYQLSLERLGASADRTAFVDDAPGNVEGARRAGLRAVLIGPHPSDEPAAIAALRALAG